MDTITLAITKIIQAQENIVGPIAIEQATKVEGLKLNWQKHEVLLQGNKTVTLQKLVEQYKNLFGQTSIEVCKDAVKELNPPISLEELPDILK